MSLTDLETAASLAQAVVTASGIILGGLFAYYKFFKDRVYRPRVAIAVQAGRLPALGAEVLLCRVTVRNLSGTKLSLVKAGTVVVVSAANPIENDFKMPSFSRKAVMGILTDHRWLEVAETISDDVALRVPPADGGLYRVSARLVLEGKTENVEIWGRSIIPASQDWKREQDEASQGLAEAAPMVPSQER